ncbi:hypothetical protein [Rubinisphaera italica]|uniref:Bacterial type II secretion system protein G n=1 Tax=Rubinisphaera italica TaxID=2527969 RepID=A0A5C5XFN2_9PLAN|nr:hypothetical protein [Rubinisphaera italica]TWT61800.1 hypothetical protein Pan54_25370 [Rubinisphaera italica]
MSDEVASKRKSGWHRLLHPKFAVPVVLLLVLIAAPFLYRSYRLSLISDPGEPFDVEAFIVEHTVPDEENALVPFRNAIKQYEAAPGIQWDEEYDDLWNVRPNEEKTKILLEYMQQIEPALLAWEKASQMPNFSEISASILNYYESLETTKGTGGIAMMGEIQAWIASENGDDVEAMRWLLCNLRSSRLIARNGGIMSFLKGYARYRSTSESILKWLAQQKLSTVDLKQLLKDVKTIHHLTPPISDHFKMDYLEILNSKELISSDFYEYLLPDYPPVLLPWIFYFQGEPDLFYRINSHSLANHLRYADLPKYQRPPLSSCGENVCYLYETSSGESIPPTQVTLERLEQAAESSTLYLEIPNLFHNVIIASDKQILLQRVIESVIHLEIYRKNNGEFPDTLTQAFPLSEDLPIDDLKPSGAVLNYVKDGPLHYRLWSVGFDGIDNGGVDPSFDRDAADLGIEMNRNDSLESPEEK